MERRETEFQYQQIGRRWDNGFPYLKQGNYQTAYQEAQHIPPQQYLDYQNTKKIIIFPNITQENFKHFQDLAKDQKVIVKLLEFIFSDTFLFVNQDLIDKIEAHPKGYVEIKELLNFKKVRQLIELSYLYHNLSTQQFISFIKTSIYLNSKTLKCNNKSIRRKQPFVNKILAINRIFFQPTDFHKMATQQELQQLLGFISSRFHIFKVVFQKKYSWGQLYMSEPLKFLNQIQRMRLQIRNYPKFDQIMLKNWKYKTYEQFIKVQSGPRNSTCSYQNILYQNRFNNEQNFSKKVAYNNLHYQLYRGRQDRGTYQQNRQNNQKQMQRAKTQSFQFNNDYFEEQGAKSCQYQKEYQL